MTSETSAESRAASSSPARDISILTVTNLIAAFLSGGAGIVAARLLRPEAYGLWQSIRMVQQGSAYVSLGVPWSMQRDIARQQQGQHAKTQATIDLTATWVGVGAAALAIVLVLVSLLTAWPYPALLSVLVALFVFTYQFYALAVMLLTVQLNVGWSGAIDAVTSLVNLLVGAALTLRFQLLGLLAAQTIWCMTGVGMALASRHFRVRWRLNWHELREHMRFGLVYTFNGLIYLVLRSVDRILILAMLGIRALGYYGIALLATSLMEIFARTISRAMFPRLMGTFAATGDLVSIHRHGVDGASLIGIVFAPASCVAAAITPLVVATLLPAYSPGIAATQILIMATPFLIISITQMNFFIAVGKLGRIFAIQALAVGVALAGCYIGIRSADTAGAAGGMAVALMCSSVGMVVYAHQHYTRVWTSVVGHALRVHVPTLYVGSALFVMTFIVNQMHLRSSSFHGCLMVTGAVTALSAPLALVVVKGWWRSGAPDQLDGQVHP